MTTPLWIQKKIYDIRIADLEKSKYEIQAELKMRGSCYRKEVYSEGNQSKQ